MKIFQFRVYNFSIFVIATSSFRKYIWYSDMWGSKTRYSLKEAFQKLKLMIRTINQGTFHTNPTPKKRQGFQNSTPGAWWAAKIPRRRIWRMLRHGAGIRNNEVSQLETHSLFIWIRIVYKAKVDKTVTTANLDSKAQWVIHHSMMQYPSQI